MSESHGFQLERLYFGHLTEDGQRKSSRAGIIANTANITPTLAAECVRVARLIPPTQAERSHEMPGAFGLFRGETIDYILAKAQDNDAGLPQVLYILLPGDTVRWLAGNVWSFRSLAMMEMPAFAAPKRNLVPYELRSPAPSTHDEQVEALLDLLWYCQDSFKIVEGILAALVQGWSIAIVNSPASLDHRLWFIQGLLSLLPVPVRVGITFATHVPDPQRITAQIKFTDHPGPIEHHLVYDWAEGRLLASPPKDPYSRYILTQFRLDPSLVVEQTEQLARTVSWRAMQKDNLGKALAWVSRRAAIDQTVREGQPANRELVARILQEDPTLSDDLRQAYARHLLAFALALGEPESADIIPQVAITSQEVAAAVEQQLGTAVESGQVEMAYHLVRRWLLNVPETGELGWHTLLRQVAHQYLIDLLDQNLIQEVVDWLAALKDEPARLSLSDGFPGLIAASWPAAQRHAGLAQALFVMAIESLPAGQLQRMLSHPQYTRQLPPATQTALAHLQPEPLHPAPPSVLDTGARAFGEAYRVPILARFIEWAVLLHRTELVDTKALEALLEIAQSRQDSHFQTLLVHVIDDYSQVSTIQVLEQPGPRILVQLLLLLGRYNEAVEQLEFYQHTVFGLEHLDLVSQIAGEAYSLTPLPPDRLTRALHRLEGSQIRTEIRALIYCGALINCDWAEDQDYAASRLTTMIFNDAYLIDTIGHTNSLHLLRFHAHQHRALDTLRVGAALVDNIIDSGPQGARLIAQMWPLITWDDEVKEAALELLRRYIRGVPLDDAPDLLRYLENALGPAVAGALRATCLMRRIIGPNNMMNFAEEVHITASLFIDIATIYHGAKDLPPNHRLRRDLDTMTGGLSEAERRKVAQNTLDMLRQTYELGRARSRSRGRSSIEDELIQNSAIPQAGVDLLRFIGGYLTGGKRIPLDLEREAMAHVFGNRSAAMFLRETNAITRLLGGLQAAFSNDTTVLVKSITPDALAGEIASLWSTLSLYNQRRIQAQFAQDCQQLADVIGVMADRTNDRVISDSGLGRQFETGQRQPRTSLQALRWIHGYFARKHTRTRS